MQIGDELYVVVRQAPERGFENLIMHDREGPIMEQDIENVKTRFERLERMDSDFPAEKRRMLEIKRIKLLSI